MVWPFGRKDSNALAKLRGADWTCADCEMPHIGMFHLAAFAPDPWPGPEQYEPNHALRLEGDFLSEDFCVLGGQHFFVRCVLPIPVHGLDEAFGFGCWGTLRLENLQLYIDHFDSGTIPPEAPFFSWLCNAVKPFNLREPLACTMHPRAGRQRPYLYVTAPEHPLATAQRDGISPEEVLHYYTVHGHRPA